MNINEIKDKYRNYIEDNKVSKFALEYLTKEVINLFLDLPEDIGFFIISIINIRTIEKPFYINTSAKQVKDIDLQNKMEYCRNLTLNNNSALLEEMFSSLEYKTISKKFNNNNIDEIINTINKEVKEVNEKINNYFNKSFLYKNIIELFILQQTFYKLEKIYNINVFDEDFNIKFSDTYIEVTEFIINTYDLQEFYNL